MNYLEWLANIFYILSTYLASKNNIHTWSIGFLSCALFFLTFFKVHLFADATLQIFFMLTCLFGWWHWTHPGSQKKELPISKLTIKQLILYSTLAIILTILYGIFLEKDTQASYPFWDTTIMTLSVLGQFLMMKRKLENWLIWIMVDTLAIPLYIIKGLYLTAGLYVLLLVVGVQGFINWRQKLRAGL